MSSKDGDAKFVEEHMAPFKQYGEDVLFMNWVEMTPSAKSADKKERDKLKKFEKRLLVIANYRLLVIKKATFGGSRTLHRIIHLYDLVEISVTEKNDIIEITYNERDKGSTGNLMRLKLDNVPAFLGLVRQLVRGITIGFADEARVKFVGFSEDKLPPVQNEQAPGIAGGFLEVYTGHCSYFRTKISPEFIRYIQFLVANNITDLDLGNCPGADPKTDLSFDIPTVFASLKFNSYFKGIILRSPVKNCTDALCSALKYNKSIARIQINTQEEQSFVNIGPSLKANPENVLQVIDLSNNTLSLESVNSLCSAISSFTHGLPILNLSRCGISSKGIQALFNAFESNFGMSLSIRELDLSYNKFEEAASTIFVAWLGHIKGVYALKSLGLAGTGVDLAVVGSVFRTMIDVQKLDLSDNKLDRPEVINELKTYIECTSALTSLNISSCNLSAEHLEEVLVQITKNKRITNLELKLSDNNIGAKGTAVLARSLADSGHLRALDISYNKIKGKGLAEILQTLSTNQSLQVLNIGKNASGSADMEDLIKALLDFLGSHPNLHTLDISNAASGKSLYPLLQFLTTNSSITSLDISGNQFGDLGASILTDALTKNTALTSLNIEHSYFSLSGWQTLCFAFATNRTLRQLPLPITELERTVPAERKEQLRDLITRLAQYLQYNSGQPYPPALPFAYPLQEPHPTPQDLAPAAHVPSHLSATPLTIPSAGEGTVSDILNTYTSPNRRSFSISSAYSPALPSSPASSISSSAPSTPYTPTSPASFSASPVSSPDINSYYSNGASSPSQESGKSLPPLPPRKISNAPPISNSQAPLPSAPTHYNLSPLPPPSFAAPPPPPPSFSPPPPSFAPPPPPLSFAPPSIPPSPITATPPPPLPRNSPPPSAPPLHPPPRNNLFAPPAAVQAPPRPAPSAPPPHHAPPPPPPSGGPPPPPPPPAGGPPPPTKNRTAVLSDISKFSKNGLKKTQTNDRSVPKVTMK